MKTLQFVVLGLLLNMISGSSLLAQCAGGTTPYTLTYDTTVIGNGSGTMSFTIPKFDPSLGTLLSADLKSIVHLSYSFDIVNQDTVNNLAHSYKSKIVRSDDIYSTALDPSAINELSQTPYVSTPVLNPRQHYTYGPAFVGFTLDNAITDGRLINFMGTGANNFDYETGTSVFISGSAGYGLSFAFVADTTAFSITYHYCAATLLSSDLLFFTAVPQSKDNVLLNWRQASLQTGRVYTVQYSTDGVTFNSLADVAENTAGAYNYNYLNGSAKKLFFRILEKNVSGEVKYSNVRTVEFNQNIKGSVQVFPTLYHAGNLQVNFPEKGDWQITLFAADGRKLTESRYQQASAALFAVPGSLGNGIYIVQSLNTHTQQMQNTRIVVQR